MSQASIQDHPARLKWNKRFSEGGFRAFPDDPAEWLVDNTTFLKEAAPGRALDVACGNGRNAAYLAKLGFHVDALDISDVAIDGLQAAASERGLSVTPQLTDLEDDPLPVGEYDVVVNVSYLQRNLMTALEQALRPGGLLLFETVAMAHVEELGHSFNPKYVLERNELLHTFEAMFVRRYWEGAVQRGGDSGALRGVASLAAERLA